MKKVLLLMAVLMAAFIACEPVEPDTPENNEQGNEQNPPKQEEVIAATLSLSHDTIELGGSAFDEAEVTITTNQTVITPVSNDSWMSAKMMGKILIVVANDANETGAKRTGTITVTVGTEDNTKSATLTVIQDNRNTETEVPVLQVTNEPADIGYEAGSTTTVTFQTNQTELSLTYAEEVEWLKHEISNGMITFTATSSNTSGSVRSVDATLIAGSAENNITATFTIKQLSGTPEGVAIGAVYENQGVIFEIGEDYIKIVSLDEGNCEWSIVSDRVGTESNPDEGIANTNLFRACTNIENYPAAKWCIDKGDDWYMPSRRELVALVNNLALNTEDGLLVINATLAAASGVEFADNSKRYWSCCEHQSDDNKAFPIRLSDKNATAYTKTGVRPVRAIKKIATK